MNRPMSVLTALAAVAVLALPIAGCGEKQEPAGAGAAPAKSPFTLVLDYFPNADHAGIYAAQASGEYARAGLDVAIKPPSDPSAPLKLLRAGRADLVVSYEPELLLAREQGATDLVAVGALVQKPLTTLMSLDRRVRTPADLKGKRVGTAGIPYQSAYLKTILTHAGVDPATVKETNVGFNLVPSMLSKKVDATLGAFWNYEGVDLQRRHKDPTIMRMEQFGVPSYAELVFVARKEDLDQDGASRVRRFMQATARGHKLLQTDPAQGVDALLKADAGLDRGLQEAAVKATLPVFFPSDPTLPFGYQDQQAWQRYGSWMRDQGLLKREPNAGAAVTDEFLPGEGVDPGVAGRDHSE
jgi:putative hydroxymethylpyrimidine transport system substrate-binding protein